jgi:hypothetical protein
MKCGGIRNSLPQMIACDNSNLAGLRADERENDRDVVRSNAPEHILLSPNGSKVQAIGMDAQDTADDSPSNKPVELNEGRVILQNVADHQPPIKMASHVGQLFGMRNIEGKRLLDQDVLASLKRQLGKAMMRGRWGGDNNGLDRRILPYLFEGQGSSTKTAGHVLGSLWMSVDHRPEAAKVRKAAHQIPAPGTRADNSNA